MGLDELGQAFDAHKVPILATAGAAVVAFALIQKKKGAGPAGPAQGVSTAGAFSSGGQTAGMMGAAPYDSSASDVYGLVQPQLESLGGQLSRLQDKLNTVPVNPAPAAAGPIAAQLYKPANTGNLVRYSSGTIAEVEGDGSQLGLMPDEWHQMLAAHPDYWYTQQPGTDAGAIFTTYGNLASKTQAAATPATG